jgi:hypothetical protein
MIMSLDITERKKNEEKLLEQIEQMKKQSDTSEVTSPPAQNTEPSA